MTVIVYDLDYGHVIEVKRGLSPRKAHKYMQWLSKNNQCVYWSCWPDDLSK